MKRLAGALVGAVMGCLVVGVLAVLIALATLAEERLGIPAPFAVAGLAVIAFLTLAGAATANE